MSGWLRRGQSEVGAMRLAQRAAAPGWLGCLGLLTLLLAGLPGLALAAPPVDPTVTIVSTGTGGLVLLRGGLGQPLVVGGSEGRTAASAGLDRHLPPWERRLALLLVPPPHSAHLPGALDLLDRRAVGRASLLGLSRRPHPTLDAWQARQREAPVVGQASIALAGDAWLRLDTGDDPASEAALMVVERGPVRLLLLYGDAGPLVSTRLASGRLPPPTAVVRLTPRDAALPPTLQPPLVITLDDATSPDSPRLLALAAGQSVQVILLPDRLLVRGDGVARGQSANSDE
jgi:hypothetical protein